MRLQQQSSGISSQQQLNNQQQTQQQQDDLFSSSSQLPSSQGGFRFGSQNAVGQASHTNPVDDFPPLNRNANGEIGQDRGSSLIPNVGFGAPANGLGFGAANPPPPTRNNGLLNALSGSNRVPSTNRVASPGSVSGRSPVEANRQGLSVTENDASANVSECSPGLHVLEAKQTEIQAFATAQFGAPLQQQREENTALSIMSRTDGSLHQDAPSHSQALDSTSGSIQGNVEDSGPEVQDPLPGMSEMDRWGLKGFSVMMNNFPDYAALVTGSDMANFGLDLNSTE